MSSQLFLLAPLSASDGQLSAEQPNGATLNISLFLFANQVRLGRVFCFSLFFLLPWLYLLTVICFALLYYSKVATFYACNAQGAGTNEAKWCALFVSCHND